MLAVLNELEMSNAERYDIAQLLAKESLLKFVEDLCKDEDGDSFYKVKGPWKAIIIVHMN